MEKKGCHAPVAFSTKYVYDMVKEGDSICLAGTRRTDAKLRIGEKGMSDIKSLGLGCMGMNLSNKERSIETIHYALEQGITLPKKGGQANTLLELMDMSVDEALTACADIPFVARKLSVLQEFGLGYLTLGEETPSLSGGEAQRLKLASEMGKGQPDTVFVFDEPTIGLHPLDVETLLHVFERLIENEATVIVIEHDLDVIKNADYVVDMGPDGGIHGGEIIAAGTPEEICGCENSKTGTYLKQYIENCKLL